MLRSSDRWEFRVQACAGSVFRCVQAPCSCVYRLRVQVCTGSVFRCVQASFAPKHKCFKNDSLSGKLRFHCED